MGRWLICRRPNPALPRDHSEENSAAGRRPRPHPGLRGRRAEGGRTGLPQPSPGRSGAVRGGAGGGRRAAAGGECAARDPGRAGWGPLGRAGARGGAGFCRDARKGAGHPGGEAAARGEGRRAGDWKDGCRLRSLDPRRGRPGLNPPERPEPPQTVAGQSGALRCRGAARWQRLGRA